jgi:hypothetical protein
VTGGGVVGCGTKAATKTLEALLLVAVDRIGVATNPEIATPVTAQQTIFRAELIISVTQALHLTIDTRLDAGISTEALDFLQHRVDSALHKFRYLLQAC